MNKKWYLLVIVLIFAAMALVACGGNAEEPMEEPAAEEPMEEPAAEEPMEEAAEEPAEGEMAEGSVISLWHGWTGAYYDAIEEIFMEYEEAHPDVKIELINQENLSDAMAVAVPAGEGPDIVAWVQDQVGRNALVGNIAPVTEFFSEDYLNENFEPAAAAAMVWQGDVWGIPEAQEGIAIVYNKELISEDMIPSDPTDFETLLANAQAFREENPDKYFLCNQGLGVTSEDAYHVAPIYFGFGGDDEVGYVDDAGNAYIDTPERLAAAEWMLQLKEVAPEETSHEICQAGITGGNYGAWWTGPWAIASLEEAGIDYGIASFGRPFVGVKLLMMGANAVDRGNEAAVADIMEYWGSEAVQTKLALVNGSVPANSAALNSAEVQEVYGSAAFGAALANGTSMPNTPFIDAQWGPVGAATAAIYSGAQEPAAALAAAQAAAEQTIADMQ
ncbi:MAG: ABC transporter substrate-binding protein [Chloroflexi bacterium]|nr:MAG: ABC transporter substrate-binding protein [Chloroflexota bacterium]